MAAFDRSINNKLFWCRSNILENNDDKSCLSCHKVMAYLHFLSNMGIFTAFSKNIHDCLTTDVNSKLITTSALMSALRISLIQFVTKCHPGFVCLPPPTRVNMQLPVCDSKYAR